MLSFSRSRREAASVGRRRGASFAVITILGSLIVVCWSACGSSGGGSTGGGGTAGAGGATHSGGSSQQGGSTQTGGGTSNNGGSTMGGGGQGGSQATCDAGCTDPFKCCGGACVAAYNDIDNCGDCGKKCHGDHPYCDHGTCLDAPPCADGGTICDGPGFCCGGACCNGNQLCCDVPGDIESGPKCVDPDNGTCPQGCPFCQ
jgi:hypothetical protein